MVKLYDINHREFGYIEVEVPDFYCNDYPQFFAKIDKDTYVRNFAEPFYTIPEIIWGSKPTDGGNLILSLAERDELIKKNPLAEKWIRRYIGSEEFIHNKNRYCLWLEDCPPDEIKKMPLVYQRVEKVREFRLASKKDSTRKSAATPWLFQERRQPKSNYLLIPAVSGERREYIPIGYMSCEVIASNAVFMIPDAKYWHFGVLTSSTHMLWTRMTCGRLGISYRYSSDVVYNNFPWPPFNREVERTAVNILLARQKYPEASFADLYDPLLMPKELHKAHEANDRAVMEAYDFPKNMTEEQMQRAFLIIYERLKNFDEFYNSL